MRTFSLIYAGLPLPWERSKFVLYKFWVMAKMWRLLCVWLALTSSLHAQEPAPLPFSTPMIADVSQDIVAIHSSFNGMQLLVFGARNQPGDVVIAVRGPQANLLLRRKERIAGMWMHLEQQKYEHIPLFYAVASTRPLEDIAPAPLRESLGLGGGEVIHLHNPESKDRFNEALMKYLGKRRAWQVPFSRITYFGESLFKAKLNLPDTLPAGSFTVEVYLFNQGRLISAQMIPLRSYKTGFDARVYNTAQQRDWLYGIGCILLALSGGWLAHRLFNRRK